MKKIVYFILTCITLIIFLLNSQTVLKGASSGLLLWFNTIIPTLLPFTILSSILLDLNMEKFISGWLTPITKPIFGISPAGNYVLFIGFLCGYPLGARTAATLIREGRLSSSEGQYLVNFSNNLSPAFITSYVCGTILNDRSLTARLIIILYLTPVIIGLLSRHLYLSSAVSSKKTVPNQISACSLNDCCYRQISPGAVSINITSMFDKAVSAAAETLLKLGAYIIVFNILSALLEASALPGYLKLFLSAIAEVTGGCKIIATSLSSQSLMLPCICALVTFGGIAGIAQSADMFYGSGLSLKQYSLFRIISAVIVFIITYIFF